MTEEVAKHYDEGKSRMDLVPPEWYFALGDVMREGAIKYDDRNWEKGMNHGKVFASAMRHLLKYHAGITHDRDTGCHHLAMAAWNVLALMSYDLRNTGKRDVPPTDPEVLEKITNVKPDVSADESDSAKRVGRNNRNSKLNSGE